MTKKAIEEGAYFKDIADYGTEGGCEGEIGSVVGNRPYKPKRTRAKKDPVTENDIKKLLKEMLDEITVNKNTFHFPASAGGFSVGGISDRLGCRKGRFFAIEAKRPGRRGEKNGGLSGLQVIFGKAVVAAGGLFFKVDDRESINEVRKELEKV